MSIGRPYQLGCSRGVHDQKEMRMAIDTANHAINNLVDAAQTAATEVGDLAQRAEQGTVEIAEGALGGLFDGAIKANALIGEVLSGMRALVVGKD